MAYEESTSGRSLAKPAHVLFLCTGNTARSILAEAILRKDGAGRFRAYSAGSQPKGVVNPLALRVLAAHGYPVEGFRSKSWDEYAAQDAPVMDVVITVCDSAAGETCPLWPGNPLRAHWGIADPAAVEGSDAVRLQAFSEAFWQMKQRIGWLLALPFEAMESADLRRAFAEMGRGESAAAMARS